MTSRGGVAGRIFGYWGGVGDGGLDGDGVGDGGLDGDAVVKGDGGARDGDPVAGGDDDAGLANGGIDGSIVGTGGGDTAMGSGKPVCGDILVSCGNMEEDGSFSAALEASLTMILHSALFLPIKAVTLVVPTPLPVTLPLETVATRLFLLLHLTHLWAFAGLTRGFSLMDFPFLTVIAFLILI